MTDDPKSDTKPDISPFVPLAEAANGVLVQAKRARLKRLTEEELDELSRAIAADERFKRVVNGL